MRKFVLTALTFATCSASYAGQYSPHAWIQTLQQGHIALQAGAYWSSQGKNQHINIDGLIGDRFTVTQRSDSNALLGLGYYLEGQPLWKSQLSYGLQAFYLPKTRVAGTIAQEDLFTNLAYHYNSSHYPLYAMVRSKTDLNVSRLSIILDAGIGPNFMRTSNYTERSLDGGITLPDNLFTGHTTTTLSATAGLGIQFDQIFANVSLECGYRFLYLGEGKLAKHNNQVLDTLKTGPVYANAAVCGLRI